ncbi:hypothetical protein [Streptomyces sp. CoH27]|uniref:hypothetical protein n=1 Tax=Streptomyces sp. CoH27 TaxID=2875763 RepID=UPI001CD474EB|nr:hypothetical protein [Streptomyces sp. CoH27]
MTNHVRVLAASSRRPGDHRGKILRHPAEAGLTVASLVPMLLRDEDGRQARAATTAPVREGQSRSFPLTTAATRLADVVLAPDHRREPSDSLG